MEHYAVRVWLPDRPGALGQVASRIGAVRGDVVGIEILERGAGRAIDELIVALPEPGLVDLLVNEIAQVEDVDVEDVRLIRRPDARRAARRTRDCSAARRSARRRRSVRSALRRRDRGLRRGLGRGAAAVRQHVDPRGGVASRGGLARRLHRGQQGLGSRRRGPCRPGRRRLGDAPRCRSRARARPQGAAVPGPRASGAQARSLASPITAGPPSADPRSKVRRQVRERSTARFHPA